MPTEEVTTLERNIIRHLYFMGDGLSPFYFFIQRIVKRETSRIKETGEFLLGDLHTHTLYSDGMNTADQLVWEAKNRGLDIVAITDHELAKTPPDRKIRLYLRYFSSCEAYALKHEIVVIPGIEFKSAEGHILGLFPTYDAPGKLVNIKNGFSSEETVELIHEAGGVAIAAHLYRISGLGNNVLKVRGKIDGVELNSTYGHKGLDVAEELKVAEVAGSDAHSRIGVGLAFTLFPRECCSPLGGEKKLESLIGYIKKRRTKTHLVSSNDLLMNLDKTRWLAPFYAARNFIERFDDEYRILSRNMEVILS